MNTEKKYKKLAINSILFAIGNLGSKLISFLMLPLYTYTLSKSEFGLTDLFITSISLLLPIFSLSVYDAVLRFGMDDKYHEIHILSNGFFITLMGATVTIIFLPILYLFDISYLCYFYVSLVVQMFQMLLAQYAKATNRINIFALNGIILSFLTATFNILFLVVLKKGVSGFFLSIILANIISNFWLSIKLRIWLKLKLKEININTIKEMLSFSLPLIPNSIAIWISNVANRYFILFFWGSALNGIFAVANKIPTLLSVMNSIFFQSWQISVIEEYENNDRDDFTASVFSMYFKFLIISTSVLLVFLKPMMKFIVSNNFYIAWKFVPILLLSVIYSSLSGFLGTNYIAAKKTKHLFITTIIGATTNIFFNIILIPKFGLYGASFSSAFSFLVTLIIRIIDSKKFFELQLNYKVVFYSHIILFIQIAMLNLFDSIIPLLICLLAIAIINKELIFIFWKNIKKLAIKLKRKT